MSPVIFLTLSDLESLELELGSKAGRGAPSSNTSLRTKLLLRWRFIPDPST